MIDAIDGSEAMLSKLRQKGIYRQAMQVSPPFPCLTFAALAVAMTP